MFKKILPIECSVVKSAPVFPSSGLTPCRRVEHKIRCVTLDYGDPIAAILIELHITVQPIVSQTWVVPQPAEWQRIGNQIDTALVFARPYLVCVHMQCEPAATIRSSLP